MIKKIKKFVLQYPLVLILGVICLYVLWIEYTTEIKKGNSTPTPLDDENKPVGVRVGEILKHKRDNTKTTPKEDIKQAFNENMMFAEWLLKKLIHTFNPITRLFF